MTPSESAAAWWGRRLKRAVRPTEVRQMDGAPCGVAMHDENGADALCGRQLGHNGDHIPYHYMDDHARRWDLA